MIQSYFYLIVVSRLYTTELLIGPSSSFKKDIFDLGTTLVKSFWIIDGDNHLMLSYLTYYLRKVIYQIHLNNEILQEYEYIPSEKEVETLVIIFNLVGIDGFLSGGLTTESQDRFPRLRYYIELLNYLRQSISLVSRYVSHRNTRLIKVSHTHFISHITSWLSSGSELFKQPLREYFGDSGLDLIIHMLHLDPFTRASADTALNSIYCTTPPMDLRILIL